MAKILITSTDVMMIQFLVSHAKYLNTKGHHVDIACSHADGYGSEGYHEKLRQILPSCSNVFDISMGRSPFSSKIRDGYKQLKSIITSGNYDLIWTNEPVMSVATRLASKSVRKKGTKVIYVVHGFQFFKGAPLRNWVFYPVEKYFSSYCDGVVNINWSDYNLAKTHLCCKKVYHIDGIGLNTSKFRDAVIDRSYKRKELGLNDEDVAVVSVGEVRSIKNQETILRAIASLNNPSLKYIICGCGDLEEYLTKLASDLGVGCNLKLLGHRYDIPEILKACDIYAQPSLREGLGIAALEAMSAGLPILTSNVQGMVDYSKTGITGYCLDPYDVLGYANAIKILADNAVLRKKISIHNVEAAKVYDISLICKQMEIIINDVLALRI